MAARTPRARTLWSVRKICQARRTALRVNYASGLAQPESLGGLTTTEWASRFAQSCRALPAHSPFQRPCGPVRVAAQRLGRAAAVSGSLRAVPMIHEPMAASGCCSVPRMILASFSAGTGGRRGSTLGTLGNPVRLPGRQILCSPDERTARSVDLGVEAN